METSGKTVWHKHTDNRCDTVRSLGHGVGLDTVRKFQKMTTESWNGPTVMIPSNTQLNHVTRRIMVVKCQVHLGCEHGPPFEYFFLKKSLSFPLPLSLTLCVFILTDKTKSSRGGGKVLWKTKS